MMIKKIELGGNEIEFKASAATSILYKRTFGKDLTAEFTSYVKNYKEVKKLKENFFNENSEPDETKLEELMNNPLISQLSVMALDLFPKLAYIMYLEANVEQREIFKKLNEEDFVLWLGNYDSNEFQNHLADFMSLWSGSSKTSVKPKN